MTRRHATTSAGRSGGALTARERRRVVLLSSYVIVTAAWLYFIGIVWEAGVILSWLFLLLIIIVSGDDRSGPSLSLRRLCLDWGGLILLVMLYRYAAALADGLGRPVALEGLATVDRAIGFGRTPTERLQELFPQDRPVPVWQIPLSMVYFSHFFAVPITAAVLWRRDRLVWLRFIKSFFTMAFVGVATYALFPAAPPWMASEQGVIDPTVRSSYFGIGRLGIRLTKAIVETGQDWSNPVAAMPSLHAGFALFLTLFFWRRVRPAARIALAAYAVSMAFVLVLTAEHWVSDVVAGWCVATASILVWQRQSLRNKTPSPNDQSDEHAALALQEPASAISG